MQQPDYATLLDAKTQDFVARTAAQYPPDAATLGVAAQRTLYDAMCRSFRVPPPPGLTSRDHRIGGVAVRDYAPAGGEGPATVVWFHGGGFVLGGLDSHDGVCADLCADSGLRVVSVDYRLAPEHPHPAAFEDSLAVARALAAAGPVLLAGDSAGGSLAAAAAHALRGTGARVLGQVLVYPTLGGDHDRGSALIHAHAPMLGRDDLLAYAALRHGGQPPDGDPTADPLRDTDFAGLPPTIIFTAECDPLADDGRDYRDRILAAGGRATWVPEPGLVHGYLRARHSVARARESFARIAAALRDLAAG